MPTAEQIAERLEAIRVARGQGASVVRFPDGASVTYKTDADLAAAEAALIRELAAVSGTTVHTILVGSSKGLET